MSAKCLSTISYNTDGFLCSILNQLKKDHIIAEWMYINHHGETGDDGITEKDHKHVLFCLNGDRRIKDLQSLRDMFNEFDPTNPKPLGVMPIENSNLADWLMYGVHNPSYLASKGLVREFSYICQDIVSSDDDWRDYEFRRAFDKLVSSKRVKFQVAKEIGYYNAVQNGILNSSDISSIYGSLRLDGTLEMKKQITERDERFLQINKNRYDAGLSMINKEIEYE